MYVNCYVKRGSLKCSVLFGGGEGGFFSRGTVSFGNWDLTYLGKDWNADIESVHLHFFLFLCFFWFFGVTCRELPTRLCVIFLVGIVFGSV